RVYLGIYFTLAKQNLLLQSIRPASLLGDAGNIRTELKHHSIDAYSILRKDWWDDVEAGEISAGTEELWDKYEQRIKNFRSALCIDITELPGKGLLPEEKAWMRDN